MTPTRFHVAEYLQDELDARGWSTRYCAERMGHEGKEIDVDELALDMTLATLDAPPGHCAWECRMGEEMAAGLAKAFGTNAQIWLNLDNAFHAKN